MAALPSPAVFSARPKRPLSQRRLAANRRNAMRSTGPRTVEGKAKVARNGVKSGLFAHPDRWPEAARSELRDTLAILEAEYRPADETLRACIGAAAFAIVHRSMLRRYEAEEARREFRRRERECEAQIAAGGAQGRSAAESRDLLRCAGLWLPTLPGGKAARTVLRMTPRLDRAMLAALERLDQLKADRDRGAGTGSGPQCAARDEGQRPIGEAQGQSHRGTSDRGELPKQSHCDGDDRGKWQKQSHRGGDDRGELQKQSQTIPEIAASSSLPQITVAHVSGLLGFA